MTPPSEPPDDPPPDPSRPAATAGAPGQVSGQISGPIPVPPARPAGQFTLDMTPDRLGDLRALMRDLTRRCDLDEAVGHDAEIAVDEAVQNVLRHAYRGRTPARIDVTAWIADGHFWVLIRDYAERVDLASIRPRPWDGERPGGMGTRLIAAVMDRVAYAHAGDGPGNTVTLGRLLDRPETPPSGEEPSSREGSNGG